MQKDSFREKLQRFDAIRPFTPEELPQVYERLLADQQFRKVVAVVMPELTFEQFAERMRGCRTNLEFQKVFCYGFLEKLLAEASKGCTINTASIDTDKRYTFVSNHRDIVLDSALLDKLLIDAGFGTTCEIAIGDNLLALPWVKDLVRVNKSFIVERSLPPKEMLAASRLLAEYMHFVISEKNDNVWIAQREGRAKDSDDRTQPSILKMMAMGGEGTPLERLRQLHIVPLAISYEYDPCDILKAKEFQCKRDNPAWKKTAQDDIDSMRTGIMGYKGEIHYHCAPCIDGWLDTLSVDMPKMTSLKRWRDTSTRRFTATTGCSGRTSSQPTCSRESNGSPPTILRKNGQHSCMAISIRASTRYKYRRKTKTSCANAC